MTIPRIAANALTVTENISTRAFCSLKLIPNEKLLSTMNRIKIVSKSRDSHKDNRYGS